MGAGAGAQGGAKKVAAAAQPQPAAQPVSPGVKKAPAKAAASARVPQCRALYDYPGGADNELTFRAGDIIQIIQRILLVGGRVS